MRMTLTDVQHACAARLSGTDSVCITGIATDNRHVRAGDLFVCIVGEHFDGHAYAAAAVHSGAVAVLCQRDFESDLGAVPVLRVDNTVRALGQLAHAWRLRTAAKVVGVTGSAGKTTVKEVLAQVLSVHGSTACNALNLNNQIGLPTSILRTQGDEKFWVMEAGISKAHDMDELGGILQPDVALILNVANAHTEGLGDKGVAWHKSTLLRHLAPHGQSLVSADYPDLVREARTADPQVQFFSTAAKPLRYRAAYNGIVRTATGEERGVYRLWLDGTTVDVESPFSGAYGTENVIAIAAIAHMLGLSNAEIVRGFATASLPQQRFQTRQIGTWCSINDTYNANPLSMKRMLEASAEKAGKHALVCLLGAMGELGAEALPEHYALGRFLATLRPKAVFWHGAYFEQLSSGLEAQGYTGICAPVCDPQEFLDQLARSQVDGGVILFKGSRSNGLERYCQAFEAQQEKNSAV
ncbi:MAG: UDP-N-acetylmuramoyl-tripeptide--D-alanyl-D-alanine ligase [Desulfovibrionaceae bacterium]